MKIAKILNMRKIFWLELHKKQKIANNKNQQFFFPLQFLKKNKN